MFTATSETLFQAVEKQRGVLSRFKFSLLTYDFLRSGLISINLETIRSVELEAGFPCRLRP